MTLNIESKEKFLNAFLIPISKVADSAVITTEPGKIAALIATTDNTVIVHAEYISEKITISKRLNIPDVKKLCRTLQCIDEEEINLNIDQNSIGYTSPNIRFKYHLYDDSIISVPNLNLAKLEKLDFNGKFTLGYNAVVSLIKGSTIATDTNKIYLTFKDKDVLGELTDKARANVDSYGIKISEDYDGDPVIESIPLNFEIFRIISSIKFLNIKSKLSSKTGVFTFDLNIENTQMRFIVSALAN